MSAGERAEILAAGKDPAKVVDLDACLGPAYPEMGASVAKFRRLAAKAGSVAAMPRAERVAYANAVEAAINAKNNAWWKAGSAIPEGPARDVGAKVRAEHAAALARCGAAERAARKPAVWELMYAKAMAEKRAGAKLSADGRKAAVKAYRAAMPAAEAAAVVMAASRSAKLVKPKAAVDWSAAGRKAWETRKRNLAAKAAAMKEAA
jgi:hypothetical protein